MSAGHVVVSVALGPLLLLLALLSHFVGILHDSLNITIETISACGRRVDLKCVLVKLLSMYSVLDLRINLRTLFYQCGKVQQQT